MSNLKWISSTGGPLILMEKHTLLDWDGINSNNTTYVTDYERACEIVDYLGLISAGKNKALVLGGEPMDTTLFQISQNNIIIVCWNYAESEDKVEEILTTFSLSQKNWGDSRIEIYFETGEIVLFDSSKDQNSLDDWLDMTIKPGKYGIKSSFFEPDNETSILLHQMSLI